MLHDLTLTLSNLTPVYPGDPPVQLQERLDETSGFQVTAINMGSHSGTHADLPRHFGASGADASTAPLGAFLGEAIVLSVTAPDCGQIGPDDIDWDQVRPGDILILRTGWESRAGSALYFNNFPALCPATADQIVARGVKALGLDLPSVDNATTGSQSHRILLGQGIMIIESLINLAGLIGQRCFFCAVPLKIAGGDGSPVRAFAVTEHD